MFDMAASLPGVSTTLPPEEEKSLVQYLLYMAEHGFPLTRKAFAWAIAKHSVTGSHFNPELGPIPNIKSRFAKMEFILLIQVLFHRAR